MDGCTNGIFPLVLILGNQVDDIQIAQTGKRDIIRISTGDLPLGQAVRLFHHMRFLHIQTALGGHIRDNITFDRTGAKCLAARCGMADGIVVIQPRLIGRIQRGGEIHQLIQLYRGAVRIIPNRSFRSESKAGTIFREIQIRGNICPAFKRCKGFLMGFSIRKAVDIKGIVRIDKKLHAGHGIHKGGFAIEIPADPHVPADNGLSIIHHQLARLAVDDIAAILARGRVGGNGLLERHAFAGRLPIYGGQIRSVGEGLRIHLAVRIYHSVGHVRRYAQVVGAGLQLLPRRRGDGDLIALAVITDRVDNGGRVFTVQNSQRGGADIVAPVGGRGVHALQGHGVRAEAEAIGNFGHDEVYGFLAEVHHDPVINIITAIVHVDAAVVSALVGKGVLVDLELVFGHAVPRNGGRGGELLGLLGTAFFHQLNRIGLLCFGIARQLGRSSLGVDFHLVGKGVGALVQLPVRAGKSQGVSVPLLEMAAETLPAGAVITPP